MSSEFSDFIILFLMSRLTNNGVINAYSRFDSKKLSYKQDTNHDIICFVNKAKVFLLFIYALYCKKNWLNGVFFCW